MQSAAFKMSASRLSLTRPQPRGARRFTHVVKANKGPNFGEVLQTAKLPLAAMCAAALLTGAIVPEEAMAARTGGRVGGSSFSARRAPPAAPRASAGGPTISNYNYYAPPTVVAPPLVGGFGFPGFGFPGFGFGGVAVAPTIVLPGAGLFSSLFQFFFLIITLSFVFNVIKGVVNNKRYDD